MREQVRILTRADVPEHHDLQVAATALVAGSVVATLSHEECRRVADLDVAQLERFGPA